MTEIKAWDKLLVLTNDNKIFIDEITEIKGRIIYYKTWNINTWTTFYEQIDIEEYLSYYRTNRRILIWYIK